MSFLFKMLKFIFFVLLRTVLTVLKIVLWIVLELGGFLLELWIFFMILCFLGLLFTGQVSWQNSMFTTWVWLYGGATFVIFLMYAFAETIILSIDDIFENASWYQSPYLAVFKKDEVEELIDFDTNGWTSDYIEGEYSEVKDEQLKIE